MRETEPLAVRVSRLARRPLGPFGSAGGDLGRWWRNGARASLDTPEEEERVTQRIVVGVDGSAESRRALKWAVLDARRRRAEVQAVHVHEAKLAYNPYEVSYASTSSPRAHERLAGEERRWREHQRLAGREEAHALLEEVVEGLGPDVRDVPIERVIREGSRPAKLLLESARHADLLVVGSRGRGGFAGLLLGSVSQQLAQHAPCPLVIVHASDTVIDLDRGETGS